MKKSLLATLIAFVFCFTGNVNAFTYYWVGNSGNWTDYANHWATTSGGLVFYNQAPTATDDVVFDANSFTLAGQTVTINGTNANCNSFTITSGISNVPTFINAAANLRLRVYGSFTLQPNISWQYAQNIQLYAASGMHTITCAGNAITQFSLEGTGTWTQTDSLFVATLAINAGNYSTANYPLRSSSIVFGSINLTSFDAGTSNIRASNWDARAFGRATIDADSATFYPEYYFYNSGGYVFNKIVAVGSQVTFITDSCTVHNFIQTGAILQILGSRNTITRLISDGLLIFYRPNTVHYAEVRSNVRFDPNGSTEFDTLFLNNPGSDFEIHQTDTVTINSAMFTSSVPCSQLVRIFSATGFQAVIKKASGAIVVDNINISNIKALGAATFTANNSVDGGNVTGWTINATTPRTVFWVGEGGTWSDPNHWSLISGGAGGACPPSVVDSIVFDQNSFTTPGQLVTITSPGLTIKSLNGLNVTNTPSVTCTQPSPNMFNINCYGSFEIAPQFDWIYVSNGLVFSANTGTHTVRLGNNYFREVSFSGTGTWNWSDSAEVNYVTVDKGTVNLQMEYLRALSGFMCSTPNTAHIDFGDATIRAQLLFFGVDPLLITDADSADFVISGMSVQHPLLLDSVTAIGGGLDGLAGQINHLVISGSSYMNNAGMLYKDVVVNEPFLIQAPVHIENMDARDNVTINQNCTIDTIRLNNPGYVFSLELNKTVTCNQIYGSGSCLGQIALVGTGVPSPVDQCFFVSNSTNPINVSDIVLTNVAATGSATFNAANATVNGHVTGWNYSSAPPTSTTFYWVNGSGSWYDPAHWSSTSGGPTGTCIPQIADDVIFDANSFSSADTVTFLNGNAYCHNITCTGIPFAVTFTGTATVSNTPLSALNVSGDLNFQAGIDWTYDGYVLFTGNERGRTINANDVNFSCVQFDGNGGEWNLTGPFRYSSRYYHLAGRINTNGNNFSGLYHMEVGDSLYLGTSNVDVMNFYAPISPSWTGVVDADSAFIQCNEATGYSLHIRHLHYREIGWTTNSLNLPYCLIDTLTTDGNGGTAADAMDDLHINHAVFSGNFFLIGPTTIDYLEARKDLNIQHSTSIDTLYLNNGNNITSFSAGDTVTVNDMLLTNGSGSAPVTVNSLTPGSQTTLLVNADTLCMEWTRFQDVIGAGTSTFFAGWYSVDLGNNTNILFTACVIPHTNVWPGDANRDLVVDNDDVLFVGLAFNETGYVRDTASLNWWAQSCIDWNRIFNSGVNINNADCDGNGTIDSLDLTAVYLNYGLTHPALVGPPLPPEPAAVADLWLDPPTLFYDPGDFVTIPVKLGTAGNPVASIYGVAYDISYDSLRIVPGSVYMTYPPNWFTPVNNSISFQRDDWSASKIDDSQSRTSLTNTSGNGNIAYLHFQVDSFASGMLPLSIINIRAVEADGTPLGLTPIGTTLYIDSPLVVLTQPHSADFDVFPNPTTGNTNLSVHAYENETLTIEILDVAGQIISVQTKTIGTGQNATFELVLGAQSAGIYICRVTGEHTSRSIRIVKSE